MGIEESNTVDFVGIKSIGREAVLTATDAFEWLPETDDEHVALLQKKINSYLTFIESGELFEKYPNAKGRKILIEVIGKYALNLKGEEFYSYAKEMVNGVGYELRFRQHKRH